MFEIEKNIPLPPEGRKPIYPFDIMEIGDSFYVPDQGNDGPARNSGNYFSRKTGKKFASRVDKDGIRFWRVK